MRQLTYYIASTVDGFIAHEDGSFDGFLVAGDHVSDYLEALQYFDVVLMGRKTYDVGVKAGITNPYPQMQQYVISKTLQTSPDENITIVSEGISDFVKGLKAESGQDIYLCGGGILAAQLFAENLIDNVVLKVNPVLLGSGIPLIAGRSQPMLAKHLRLVDSKIYDNSLVLLAYQVLQADEVD